MRLRRVAAIIHALAVLTSAAPVAAVTFTVNSTGDGADTNTGDGVCDSDVGTPGLQCTLPEPRR